MADYAKDRGDPRGLFVSHDLKGKVIEKNGISKNLFAFLKPAEGNRVLDLDNLRRYKVEQGQLVSTDNKFTKNNALVWVFVISAGAFIAGGILLFSKFLQRRNAAG